MQAIADTLPTFAADEIVIAAGSGTRLELPSDSRACAPSLLVPVSRAGEVAPDGCIARAHDVGRIPSAWSPAHIASYRSLVLARKPLTLRVAAGSSGPCHGCLGGDGVKVFAEWRLRLGLGGVLAAFGLLLVVTPVLAGSSQGRSSERKLSEAAKASSKCSNRQISTPRRAPRRPTSSMRARSAARTRSTRHGGHTRDVEREDNRAVRQRRPRLPRSRLVELWRRSAARRRPYDRARARRFDALRRRCRRRRLEEGRQRCVAAADGRFADAVNRSARRRPEPRALGRNGRSEHELRLVRRNRRPLLSRWRSDVHARWRRRVEQPHDRSPRLRQRLRPRGDEPRSVPAFGDDIQRFLDARPRRGRGPARASASSRAASTAMHSSATSQ